MKGTIHYCLEELMLEKYGQEAWEKCVQLMGYEEGHSFDLAIRDDIDEKETINLFVKSAEAANVSLGQIFDDFGEHWSVVYAPNLYGAFFQGSNSTKDALLNLDWVHSVVTKKIENARPPRFHYDRLDENILEIEYKSDRHLIDLFISLIKGLHKKYNDHSLIEKLSESKIRLTFNTDATKVVDKSSAEVSAEA